MHGRTGSQHNIMSQSHTYTIPVSSLFDPLLARLIHQPYMKHLFWQTRLLIILKTCVGMKHDATATPCCETITHQPWTQPTRLLPNVINSLNYTR